MPTKCTLRKRQSLLYILRIFYCFNVLEKYFVLQKTYCIVTVVCVRHHLCFCRGRTWNGCQRFGGHHLPPRHIHLLFCFPFNILYVVYVFCCLITPGAFLWVDRRPALAKEASTWQLFKSPLILLRTPKDVVEKKRTLIWLWKSNERMKLSKVV